MVPCGSGRVGRWKSNELGDGPHTFGVYGTDDNGNQGPTIQHTWRIGKLQKHSQRDIKRKFLT